MDKMREEFEEWECNADNGPLTDPMRLMRDACSLENYGIVQVQHNWEVWQAASASNQEALNILFGAAKEMLRIVGLANQGSNAYNRAIINLHEAVTKAAESRR